MRDYAVQFYFPSSDTVTSDVELGEKWRKSRRVRVIKDISTKFVGRSIVRSQQIARPRLRLREARKQISGRKSRDKFGL